MKTKMLDFDAPETPGPWDDCGIPQKMFEALWLVNFTLLYPHTCEAAAEHFLDGIELVHAKLSWPENLTTPEDRERWFSERAEWLEKLRSSLLAGRMQRRLWAHKNKGDVAPHVDAITEELALSLQRDRPSGFSRPKVRQKNGRHKAAR